MDSFILAIIRIIPRPLGLLFFRALGLVLFYLASERRRIALFNLDIAFGQTLSSLEKRHIARESFKNMVCMPFEVLKLAQYTPEQQAKLIGMRGQEHLNEALQHGKGVLAVSAHYGNFPLLLTYMAALGHDVHVVVRHFKNDWVQDVYTRIFARLGVNLVPKGREATTILKTLKRGGVVGYVLDQNMQLGNGVFVDFFGHKASTIKGVATFSGRYGSPILPGYIESTPRGHRVSFEKPFVPNDPKVMKERELELTQRFTARIEEWIRNNPQQWIWIHRRWKARPEGEAPMYPRKSKLRKRLKRRLRRVVT